MSEKTRNRILCRIGPVCLAACSDEDSLLIRTSAATGADAVLPDFEADAHAKPDLTLDVQTGRPQPPGAGATQVYKHRTGWDVYESTEGLLAVKAIPYNTASIKRSVWIPTGSGCGVLTIHPEASEPYAPFAYTLSELLTLMVSAERPLLLAHSACCLDADGRAHLFVGKSGAGKTTLAELWRGQDEGDVLGDESHIVCPDSDGFRVHGTPWPGSSGCYANKSALLAGVYFLSHGAVNHAEALEPSEGCVRLLAHSFLPVFSKKAVENATDIALQLIKKAPVRDLQFRPTPQIVEDLLKQRWTKGTD